MTFYVVDINDRSLSWSVKEEKGERFASMKAAEKRARELSAYEPGKRFEIVQAVAAVECPVGQPKVTAL